MSPERDDAALIYRFLRSHGRATLGQIVDECLPVLSAGPSSSVLAVRRRSTGRALMALGWMRAQGVVISCISLPGYPSEWVLGEFAQGLANIGTTSGRIDPGETVTATGSGDFMGAWHGD